MPVFEASSTKCFPNILEPDIELATDLIVGRPRDADASGLSRRFQAR
jgi:hypothetical protein